MGRHARPVLVKTTVAGVVWETCSHVGITRRVLNVICDGRYHKGSTQPGQKSRQASSMCETQV